MSKRLYRSRRDKVVGGVSGGIADYLGIDVVLVRILWVILALAGGPGVIGYIICWIVIPEEPVRRQGKKKEPPVVIDSETEQPAVVEGTEEENTEPVSVDEDDEECREPAGEKGRRAIGLLLIVTGGYFLLHKLSGGFLMLLNRFLPGIYWHQLWALARSLFWPSLLVLAGIILIIGSIGRRKA